MSTSALNAGQRLLAHLGQRQHHLQLGAVALAQPDEAQLAGVAEEDHPAGDRDLLAGAGVGLELRGVVRLADLGERVRALDRRSGTAWTPAVEQPLPLLPPHPHLLGQVVLHCGIDARRLVHGHHPIDEVGLPRAGRRSGERQSASV